ncbi:MAG TPA: MHYT domain-containing protein [Micromonosporaceae bacterium]|nr:MHYT domain-containing protein [Micromonosporaceae bacterium]
MPTEVHHFTYGLITPVLSFAFSVLGSLLALSCTARARNLREPVRRARWLLLASWALGGTGVWVMHFTAMLGFSVPSSLVRYDVPLTVASWAAAITMVGVGLFVAGMGHPSILKILLGGLLTGLGVAAMHYIGMAAMRVNGDIGYDRGLVAASVAIAVVAATVALWFTVTLHRPAALFAAALIMGVAVNGMHFTGMAALRVYLHTQPAATEVPGASALTFLGPMMLFVAVVVIVLVSAQLRAADVEARWAYPGLEGHGPAAAGARPPEPVGSGAGGRPPGVRGAGSGHPPAGRGARGAGPAGAGDAGSARGRAAGGSRGVGKGQGLGRGRRPGGPRGAGGAGPAAGGLAAAFPPASGRGAFSGGSGVRPPLGEAGGRSFDPWRSGEARDSRGGGFGGGAPQQGAPARSNGYGLPPDPRDRRPGDGWGGDPPTRGRR